MLEPRITDLLHRRMSEIYGHRWTSAYTREALDTWAKGLAGMTVDHIRRGVERCISGAFDWPPTLPEFRQLCLPRPEDFGLPNERDAYTEAVQMAGDVLSGGNAQPSHPAVYHAAFSTGFGLLANDAKDGRKRFAECWAQAVEDVVAGRPFKYMPPLLPRRSVVPMSVEEREAMLAEVDRKLEEAGIRRATA